MGNGKEYTLWPHQEIGIARAKDRDTFGLFYEPGLGKSFTALKIIQEKMEQEKKFLRGFIFAPPVVLTNWRREIAKFTDIDLYKVQILDGSGANRLEVLSRRNALIYILNYQSLLMKELFQEMKKFKPEFCIFDECHRLKNPQASTAKRAAELADIAKYKLGLTGTPVLNSPLDLFQQYRVFDGGKTFGRNYFVFRAKYFSDKNSAMPAHVHFPDWQIKKGSIEEFNRILNETGAMAKKDECLSLPPLIRKRIDVGMSPPQRKAYEAMKKDFISYMDNGKVAVAQLAITKALRMMQIVSGFVTVEGDENETIVFKDNPRATALKELLVDILENPESKIIVWAVFHKNYEDIRKVCESLGQDPVEINGTVSSKQREEAVSRFTSDPKCRVLIGHPGSGGVGINLVEAAYSIFYSRNFSLENDLQAEARNYRGGSERHKTVYRIDLVTPDSIDEHVMARLTGKQDISTKVLSEIVRDLKEEKTK